MTSQLSDLKEKKKLLMTKIRELKNNNSEKLEIVDLSIKLERIKIDLYLLKNNPKALEKKKNKFWIIGFLNWPLGGVYEGVSIYNPADNLSAIVEFNDDELNLAHEIVDIFSFYYHKPFFLDENFSKEILETFEITSEFSEDHIDCFCFKEIFKNKFTDFYVVPRIKHPELFSLYNSSLKQIDPFAKCVFLFRIIEYYHENILHTNISTESFVNDLVKKVMKHRFFPVIYEIPYPEIKKNLVLEWKRKFRYIVNHNIHQNKTVYDFIYKSGRCGVAHGRGTSNFIMYHTKNNYREIKKINIILDLMSRYLIEKEENILRKYLKFNY